MDRRQALHAASVLLGGAVSASCTRAVLSGNAASGAPSAPALHEAELRQVAAAAERIIPRTDTPGAIDAGVPHFIHRVVSDWYTREERRAFIAGLASLDREAQSRFGVDFVDASAVGQDEILAALEAAEHSGPGSSAAPIFSRLKELTVLGFYTSEVGAKAELVYRPMPGAYRGDALFHDHGRQWQY